MNNPICWADHEKSAKTGGIMELTQICRTCERSFQAQSVICPHCGTRVPRAQWAGRVPEGYEPPRWIVARLLAFGIFVGLGGLHRFYIGRTQSGLVQLLTFGGCFFWQFWDMIRLADNDLPDAYGFPLKE